MQRYNYVLLFLISLCIVVVAYLAREQLSQFRNFGLLGIFLINLFGSATIFLPAPAIASVVAGGVIYPPVLVALVSAMGASLGDMVGFLLGASGKGVFLNPGKFGYKISKGLFRRFGGFMIFLFALIPNPFFDAFGIIAGLFSYSPIRFFFWMFLGRLLRNLILAYSGALLS